MLMNGRRIFAGWLAVTAFVFALGVRGTLARLSGEGEAPRRLPPFSMAAVNAGDKTSYSLSDLRGRPWVAGFIFAHCAGPCPLITRRMGELQRDLPRAARLVSFTVDPDRDTPEALAAYARRAGAQPGRWVFLRGDKGELYRLMYEGFKLPLAEDRQAPSGFRVTHAVSLVLVDAEGRVRGLYSPNDERALERLKADARKLAGADLAPGNG